MAEFKPFVGLETSEQSILENDTYILQRDYASSVKGQSRGTHLSKLLSPAPIGHESGSRSLLKKSPPVPPLHTPETGHFLLGCSQDDCLPTTPKRNTPLSKGLSSNPPPKDTETGSSSVKVELRTPLTPKLDSTISYGSPASTIPRRSRGMDFSRAATHLHHSTLAAHPDPESSPVVSGRGVSVPRRNGNTCFDSPMRSNTGSSGFEHGNISSSVGSTSILGSDSDSDSDDDVAMRDDEDTITMTPQVSRMKIMNGNVTMNSPGGDALTEFTTGANNLLSYRERSSRSRRKDSVGKRSSNGWRYDRLGSPGFCSPPVHNSIESNENYFQRELSRRSMQSRRESLSLGTDDLSISDAAKPTREEDKEAMETFGITPVVNAEERRNVIKRAVTARRSHLVPRSKNFARIRAELMEEGAPVDVENRREAEVIRQVKERDEHRHEEVLTQVPSQPNTTASSPSLIPLATATPCGDVSPPDDNMSEANMEGGDQASTRRSSSRSSFSLQASRHGAGPDFWSRFLDDDRMRTPPPLLFPRGSSTVSIMSEDASMSRETASTNTSTAPPVWPGSQQSHHTRNSSPAGSGTRSGTPTTAVRTEFGKKAALGKRRRDDDFDAEFFKRRAVSPGLSSIAGSPIMAASPAQKEATWWSMSKGSGDGKRETPGGHVAVERVGSQGSENGGRLGRRVGMQGMNEAGESMMNMSIE